MIPIHKKKKTSFAHNKKPKAPLSPVTFGFLADSLHQIMWNAQGGEGPSNVDQVLRVKLRNEMTKA